MAVHSYTKGKNVTEFLPQDLNLIKWEDFEPSSWKAIVHLIDCSVTLSVPYDWVKQSHQRKRYWMQDNSYLCYYKKKPKKFDRPNWSVIFTIYFNKIEARFYNVNVLMLWAIKSE